MSADNAQPNLIPSAADHAAQFDRLSQFVNDTRASDPKRNAEYAREIISLGRVSGHSEYLASGLRFLGVALLNQNKPLEALPHSLEALDLFSRLERDGQVAAVQIELGMLYSALGSYPEAIDYFELSIVTNTRLGSQQGRFVSMYQLAQLHYKLQNYDEALGYLTENQKLAEELGRPDFEAASLALQIEIHLRLGDQLATPPGAPNPEFDLAMGKLEHAHSLDTGLTGQSLFLVDLLVSEGQLRFRLGDPERATVLLGEALENAELGDNPAQLARCLHGLGVMNLQDGKGTEAQHHLERAAQIFSEINMRAELAQTHRDLSAVFKANGDLGRALEHFEHFHELDASLRSLTAEHRARALAVRLDLERTKRESELYQLRSQELSQLNERLQTQAKLLDRQAREDGLTGLSNRRHLEEYAFEAFERAKERLEPLSLVIADIDNFKLINDSCSHTVGDQVLQTVATILRSHCRRGDLAARYGGEEFVFVLAKTPARDAWRICERVRQAVRQYPWHSLHPALQVTISLGFSSDLGVDNHERMLAAADAELYNAKNAGRNCTRPKLEPLY